MYLSPTPKFRLARYRHLAVALLFLLSPGAFAVPGDEADPPMPPTSFGNLFEYGPNVRACRIGARDENSATIQFQSNYPFNRARYLNTSSVWSSWQSLSGHEYVCATPACLWFGGQVEIRGCTDSAGTNCSSACTVNVGPGVGGRPVVDPAGLPIPTAGHVGCAQSDHTNLKFVARWTGAPASGYPRVRDVDGNLIALSGSASTSAGVSTGTYTIPAGWTSGFAGTWTFEFQIDAGRTHLASVKVIEHCLNQPRVYQVDTGGTRTEVYDGSTLAIGAASRMVIETGNAGVELTNHVLDPATQTLGTVFTSTQPPAGTTITESWSEAANGWDGYAYTSPTVTVNLESVCPSGQRLVNGSCEACPDYKGCVAGVVTTTQWCSTGSPPSDARMVSYQSCVNGTTQNVTECVEGGDPDPADTPCPICGPTEHLVENSGVWSCVALTCPPGQFANAGRCEPCTDYQACSNGSLVTQQWCQPGPVPTDAVEVDYQACVGGTLTAQTACLDPGDTPPGNAREVDHQSCVDGTTQTVTACVAAGDPAPSDAPCTSCPSGQRLVAGSCEACPVYKVCSGDSLVDQQWCNAGSPPADATTVNVQWCDSGTTRTRTECVAAGDTPPADAPCSTCPAGQRLVGLNCEACPTYKVCSGNSLMDQQWCSTGSPPADATTISVQWCDSGTTRTRTECVAAGDTPPADAPCSTCPAGQRLVGLNCETCPTYKVCSGNSLVDRNWCQAGSPPADATLNTYKNCSGGVLNDVTECLSPGDSPTSDASRYSYRACNGNSLVTRYSCSPQSSATLESYRVCTGNSLANRTACVAPGGNAPASATTISVQWCDSGTTRTRTQCVAAGDSPPSDAPCTSCPPGQRLVGLNCEACPTYKVCSGNSLVDRDWCQSGSPPADASLNTYKRCTGAGNLVDTTECVAPGGTPTTDESRFSYKACDGTSLVDRYACSPRADATLNTYQQCTGAGNLSNVTECLNPGDIASLNEQRHSYKGCSGNSLVTRYSCSARADATLQNYKACSGSSLANRTACVLPGNNPPANASLNTYKRCTGAGNLSNRTECVPAGGTPSPDESRYSYQGCSGTSLVTRYSCSPRGDSWRHTYKACSGGVLSDRTECLDPGDSETPDAVRYSYKGCSGTSLVTRYACSAREDATLQDYKACSGSSLMNRTACVLPGNNPPADASLNTYKRCTGAGNLSNRTECVPAGGTPSPDESRYSYQGCSGTSLVTRYSCSPRGDSWTHTYKACSGAGVLSDRTECLDPGDTETPDAVRHSYQGCSGTSLVTRYSCSSRGNSWRHTYKVCSGAGVLSNRTECLDPGDSETPDAVRHSYQGCSGTSLVTRYSCSSRGDSWRHTYKACSGGVLSDRTECLDPGDSETADAVRHSYQGCSGTSLVTRYSCSSRGDSWRHTYKACSGGVLSDRTECLDPGDSETADAVVGTRTYCDGAEESTESVCGADRDDTPLHCGSGLVMNSDGCCETCTASNASGPSSCPSGQTLRLDTATCTNICEISCPSTPNTPMPASTSDGQWWEWNSDDDVCAWEEITIPQPAWIDECGTCGQVIGMPPTACRIYTSCGYRWDATLGWWVEYYSGSSYIQQFN